MTYESPGEPTRILMMGHGLTGFEWAPRQGGHAAITSTPCRTWPPAGPRLSRLPPRDLLFPAQSCRSGWPPTSNRGSPRARRFEHRRENSSHRGRKNASVEGKALTLTRTEVGDEYEGTGYTGQLVQQTLDDARTRDLAIIPECTYVQNWLRKRRTTARWSPPRTVNDPIRRGKS
ncbi:GNAT family N-acetyltransferase [Rhodococcus koreensis]|uniref:GNAT family N-acetyltransferase n=1 Tax=Rhodococcus koreensis TaxID=99653 RepID=UPI0019818BA2|nr:N-acetyltransferase [Rhodococcus koreensis]